MVSSLLRTIPLPLIVGLIMVAAISRAQPPPACDLVDSIDYPIDISDTLREAYDDFGLFRARFGGLHTGLDIGFNRRGEPVRAAANGRVTYSDINGWDTEKGVVIVEHRFPDGSFVYSLYGHMEQTDTILFPLVGDCVRRGQILGTIGWPSRGRPHLHYEIRTFLPDDGGPGYVDQNPLLEGWSHPLDFTELWRARLTHGTTGYATFSDYPTVPPVLLDNGLLALASQNRLTFYSPPYTPLWSIELPSAITGTAPLPGGRIVVHSRDGQAATIQDARFLASWKTDGPDIPFVHSGDMLVFPLENGGLAAYTASGEPVWRVDGKQEAGRVLDVKTNGTQVAVVMRVQNRTNLRVVTHSGEVVYEGDFDRNPTFSPRYDGWLLLDGSRLMHVSGVEAGVIANTGTPSGRTAALVSDSIGNSYVHLGDRQSTLAAFGPSGELRWITRYPSGTQAQAPIMALGSGCLLFSLDSHGTLNVFNSANGTLVHQVALYAGGATNAHPRARLLRVDSQDRALMGAGFLSLLAVDGAVIGGDIVRNCVAG
jgi:hypothetical protein